MTNHWDVLFVGNAIMDVLSPCDDAFLKTYEIEKGGMNLIDEARALSLYQAMPSPKQQSGGSAANSAYGFALLGGKCAFSGQVAADDIGTAFISDLTSAQVDFVGVQDADGPATARSMIFVTPDKIRSMNTFLGTSLLLSEHHLSAQNTADIIYLEGYLFDAPEGPAIFDKAAQIAENSGGQLALSLSDAWCVERHFDAMSAFIKNHVSILFSNADEMAALGFASADDAFKQLGQTVDELIVTQGDKGAQVFSDGEFAQVPAMPSSEVTDTTGAGDLFASGYLFGRTSGYSVMQSAELASLCAGEIICHYGARPEADISLFCQQLD